MKLCLKNIGKIKNACVEINGITVIAGNNNTGKSTIGKALFAVFNSLYKSDEKLASERSNSIHNLIMRLYRDAASDIFYDWDCIKRIRNIFTHPYHQRSIESLKNEILEILTQCDEEFITKVSQEDIDRFLDGVTESLKIDDDTIFRTVLQRRLDGEFNEQISNQFVSGEAGEITLEIRNEQVTISVENDKVQGLNKRINLGTEAIYIDDPFVLDEIGKRTMHSRRFLGHRNHLLRKLEMHPEETNVVEELVATNKLSSIYGKISAVCPGEIVTGSRSNLGYKTAGSEKALRVENLSTGLKTFVILKMLLVNGRIEPNGTIVLDEPEIHLHPAWQILFAELIVLLHCEFGLHILLNTHSPYFLNAIEVYSAKYGVDDRCKYYLAREDGDVSYIDDVTNNIERIYSKLARPLQDLENERYSDD